MKGVDPGFEKVPKGEHGGATNNHFRKYHQVSTAENYKVKQGVP